MGNYFLTLIVLSLITTGFGQNSRTSPTKARGLIITAYKYPWYTSNGKLIHLEAFPGYDNITGSFDYTHTYLTPVHKSVVYKNPQTQMRSVDVDVRTGCVYLHDYSESKLVLASNYSAELNNITLEDMNVPASKGINVAVDWLSHTVYWTDPAFGWIFAAPGQKSKLHMSYRKIIVEHHLDVPSGIAVDPFEGKLIWSARGKELKIESANLDGSSRETWIGNSHLVDPAALDLDIAEKRLYWINRDYDKVLTASYYGQGNDIRVVKAFARLLPVSDIVIFRDLLYVIDSVTDIYTINRTEGANFGKSEADIIIFRPYNVYGIAVYAEEKQPLKDKDYCDMLDCDQFCISTKTGATCMCAEGYLLNDQTKKCQEDKRAYTKALAFANTTHICLVHIEVLTRKTAETTKCVYSVIKQSKTPPDPVPNRQRRQAESSTEPTTTTAGIQTPTQAPTTISTTTQLTTKQSSTTQPSTSQPTIPKPTTTSTTTPTTTMTTTEPVLTAATGDLIKWFDMDMVRRIFFFATGDNSIYMRYIDLPIENEAKVLIAKATNVTGLCYDALDTDYVFWTQSDGYVWKVKFTTEATEIINNNNKLENPRNIIVLLKERKLAMISGKGWDFSIVTMNLDGSEFKIVVSDKSEIRGLTYNREKQLLYYGRDSYVYTASLDGETDGYEFNGFDSSAYILFNYQNFMAWIYSNDTHGSTLSSRNNELSTPVNEINFINSTVVDIKPLDVNLQLTNITSPCKYDNGLCEQMCLTKYTNGVFRRVCECKFGYKLENEVNCTTDVVDNHMILVVDWGDDEIRQIDLVTNEVHAVPGDVSAKYMMGVYFDPKKFKVIIAQSSESVIYAVNLNGTDRQILVDLGSAGFAYRFDMDMTTGNLYFSAYYSSFIGVVTQGGLFTKIKSDFGWDSTFDIGVHPEKGLMFYTVVYNPTSYVGRANMDGTNATQIIKGENVSYPDSLAINYLTNRLYWADSGYNTIQDCDFDGKDCHTIVNMTGTGADEQLSDIVTDGKYLYYSTHKKDHVVKIELKSPYKTTEIGKHHLHGYLDTMAYYSSANENIQGVSRACSARNGLGDCSTICIPTPSGRTCACEHGVSLKQDQRVCENLYQCPAVIEQTVKLITNVEKVIEITMHKSCLGLLDDKCHFRCPDNFEPLLNTLMVCTSVGWSMESRDLCKEARCKAEITNGKIDENCNRGIGDKCEYTCDVNYVKTKETAVCTKSGDYHVSDDSLCEPFKCTESIANGVIDRSCPRTIGSSCKYKCNEKFYTPNSAYPEVKCMTNGWNTTADLCQESVCSDDSFQNGRVSNTCEKKLGQACTFECNEGYVKSTQEAFCKSDKMWHPSDACTPFLCSNTFANGKLGNGCARTIGSICSYTCDKFYTPTIKKSEATCQPDGWNQHTLCGEAVCDDNSLKNGKVSGNCLKKIGDVCAFDCNQGYVNTTHLAFCNIDTMWHPTDACSEFQCSYVIENGAIEQGCSRSAGSKCSYTCNKHFNSAYKEAICTTFGWVPESKDLCEAVSCPSSVPNGKISMPCDLTVGSTCDYRCNDGYTATEAHPNVTCKRTGKWQTDNLCLVPPGKMFELSVPGVATGLSVLAIIAVILVAVVICLVRRKLKTSKYGNFDGSGTAVDNPGYRSRMNFPHVRNDEPHSSVDDTQMKPVFTTSISQSTVDEDGRM